MARFKVLVKFTSGDAVRVIITANDKAHALARLQTDKIYLDFVYSFTARGFQVDETIIEETDETERKTDAERFALQEDTGGWWWVYDLDNNIKIHFTPFRNTERPDIDIITPALPPPSLDNIDTTLREIGDYILQEFKDTHPDTNIWFKY